MARITNITLENIKGFGMTHNSFDVEIISNKFNILVAPNGFGKSSITTAFDSLTSRKIELDKQDYHQENESLPISLSINEEGKTYTADKNKNEISNNFKVFCVRNRLYAKAVGRNLGNYSTTTGHLAISSQTIKKTIPEKVYISYKYTEIKKSFGANARVLPNIGGSVFQNLNFIEGLDTFYSTLEKLDTKIRKEFINNIIDSINALNGSNSDAVLQKITDDFFLPLKNDDAYPILHAYVRKHFRQFNEANIFFCIYQLQLIYLQDKKTFKKAITRAKYEVFKRDFDANINLLGSTWRNIKTKEEKGKLVVHFPKADNISYGQRDSLTLCVELQEINSKVKDGDKCIIVIDEVFDYLDDINLTATQYYLSEIVNEMGKRCTIYPIIMTHLSPEYFRNFVFNPKKMKVIYLKEGQARPLDAMKKLLVKREDKTTPEDIKNGIAHCLLHYSPDLLSRRAEFKSMGLRELWGESTNFLSFLVDEVNNYLSGSTDFDPYAVSTAVRIRIEKLTYDKLNSEEDKDNFVKIHKTKNKLDYAEDTLNEDLPDIYYMLGIIYNDSQHLHKMNSEKPVVYRLNSLIIQDMISKIFSYSSTTPITLAHIH